jgi:hypothetical protein
MLKKRLVIVSACFLLAIAGYAQTTVPGDTIPVVADQALAIDTSLDYEDVLDELGDFLDSILAPRSYFLASNSLASGHFNYQKNSGIEVVKKLIFSPTVGYYHKSGPGITVAGNIVKDGQIRRLYQYSLSPSFDFIQSRKWAGGLSYTRYITKDSLSFYTTPLQNEMAGYFLWRKAWLQPGIAASFGWGSRKDLQKRVAFVERIYNRQNALLRWLRRNRNPVIDTVVYTTKVEESIRDFLVTTSLRHTFYWLDLSKHNDYIKFTPMLTFSSGTQKFGFNRTTGTTINSKDANVQFSRGDVNLDDKLKFQLISLTLYLRPEYSIGKFFIQPQLIIDYYFPAEEKGLTTLFSLNAGFIF